MLYERTDSSLKKWENLLHDITSQEHTIIKSKSLIKKLFESTANLDEEVCSRRLCSSPAF